MRICAFASPIAIADVFFRDGSLTSGTGLLQADFIFDQSPSLRAVAYIDDPPNKIFDIDI